MKEEAASIVVRDCWLLGHRSIELRQDGRTTIFYCTLCGTRCYSDAALADHLKGSVHARHVAGLSEQKGNLPDTSMLPSRFHTAKGDCQVSGDKQIAGHYLEVAGARDSAGLGSGDSRLAAVPVESDGGNNGRFLTSVRIPLEWGGCGQLFFQSISGAGKPVGAAWFCWQGKPQPVGVDPAGEAVQELGYSMIVFPYSDGIGRAGFWEPVIGKDENGKSVPSGMQMHADLKDEPFIAAVCKGSEMALDSPENAPGSKNCSRDPEHCEKGCSSKDKSGQSPSQNKKLSQKNFRRDWKRRQGKSVERMCLICYQTMVPGKNVAALINSKSGKMLCASRNRRGVFHVFHRECLVDWIAVCEAKAWMACLQSRRKKARKNKKKKSAADVIASNCSQLSPDVINPDMFTLFCPECQGTGQRPVGPSLEQPRYRLAQIYEWVLEVVQARKAWMNHQKLGEESVTGLLFRPDGSPEGAPHSRGMLHCFLTKGAEFLLADDPDRITSNIAE